MFLSRAIIYKALKETMVEYFAKTSLNGFRLLYFVRRKKHQRVLWYLFILLSCSFAFMVVLTMVTTFLNNPTVTTLSAQKQFIWDIPFPALSFCSVNKFSRQRIEAFARNISQKSGNSASYWLERIYLLSGYYDEIVEDYDESMAFEMELKKILRAEYNAPKILKKLAPTCEELFIECHWAGVKRNCSTLFTMIATIAGHCCMFNRREQNVETERETFYATGTGVNMGLVVVLNSSIADYYYKARSTNGFHLQIFEVHSFPDTSTGEVREVIIPTGADVSVELSILSQAADEETRQFSSAKRNCYFTNENLGKEFLSYSQSECLGRCRLESIAFLCGCLPYYTPKWSLNKHLNACAFVDLECMEHFFVTWRTYRPIELEGSALWAQDALSCGACYPLCSFNHYHYKKESTSLAKTQHSRLNRKFISKFKNNLSDVSLVKIYFPHQYVTRYNKKVLYNWYEILSNVGGVIGISIGCSIITAFEFCYFFTYRLHINLSKYITSKN